VSLSRLLLVALLLAVLCSCSAQSSARNGDASGERGASEEASAPGNSTGQETAGPAKPEPAAEQDAGPVEGPASRNTASRPAVGTNGMVSTAHPLATKAGLEVLEAGGNAFDAAVAVSAALNVVEPMMSGVGGYGAVVVYDAEAGKTRFLEVGSRVPSTLDPSIFRPPTPGYQNNRCGAPVVATPGNLNAWEAMSEEYGELEWRRLFEPAIRYADEGFVVDEELAGWLGSEYSAFPANAKSIYGRGGTPLGAGDRLVQEDLADSLRTIAEAGAGAVYGGRLGQTMVSEVQREGGFLTFQDLRDNRARWRETIGVVPGLIVGRAGQARDTGRVRPEAFRPQQRPLRARAHGGIQADDLARYRIRGPADRRGAAGQGALRGFLAERGGEDRLLAGFAVRAARLVRLGPDLLADKLHAHLP
jgi:hypothetical protein